jgi:hypothetical protein
MPFSLKKWPTYATGQTGRIDTIYHSSRTSITPNIQVLLGEILVIRTAQILEEALPEIFGRLACGTRYLDGSSPSITISANSVEDAFGKMRSIGRTGRSRHRHLKWLDTSYIRGNVEHIFDINDHSLQVMDQFSAILDELRIVRNEAAHHIPDTRKQYQNILLRYYGARKVPVPVGRFVISDRRATPAPLIKYTTAVRTLVRELCKG